MTFLSRHADAIQAAAAIITATMAVLAVVGVLLQMRAADETSRAQTAREAYAAHLALAAAMPDFAAPEDACTLLASSKGAAYEAYVGHLLYAAELMVEAETGWADTFHAALDPHAVLICRDAGLGETDDMAALLDGFRSEACPVQPSCGTKD
jgi:hypothetical protein